MLAWAASLPPEWLGRDRTAFLGGAGRLLAGAGSDKYTRTNWRLRVKAARACAARLSGRPALFPGGRDRMRIYEGSPRQDFEEVFRSMGAFIDQRRMKDV